MSIQRYGEIVCAWVKAKTNTRIDDVEGVRQFLGTKIDFFQVRKCVKVVELFLAPRDI
jgi:hypothetical protein